MNKSGIRAEQVDLEIISSAVAIIAIPFAQGAEDLFRQTEQRTEGYARVAEGFAISPSWSSENVLSFSRDGKRWC